MAFHSFPRRPDGLTDCLSDVMMHKKHDTRTAAVEMKQKTDDEIASEAGREREGETEASACDVSLSDVNINHHSACRRSDRPRRVLFVMDAAGMCRPYS